MPSFKHKTEIVKSNNINLNRDKIANYEFAMSEEFDLKSIIIKFLKDKPRKQFSNLQIATWIVDTYTKEVERKMQTSNDRRLLNATSKVQKKEILITIYRSELNRLSPAIKKIEPKIQLIKKGRRFKYCYVDNTDKVTNYEFAMHQEFDLKSIIIKFLKDNTGKEFTNSQIAAWVIDKYPKEAGQKVQTIDNKLKEKITILLYKNEIDTTLRTIVQKVEPKIKIIKKGRGFKYCYINNTDKIFDQFKATNKIFYPIEVFKAMKNCKQQGFTSEEMAQLLLSANSK